MKKSREGFQLTVCFLTNIQKISSLFWSCTWNGKVDFIKRAKEEGYFIRVFFICTSTPAINASRIAKRVMEGGHDVPIHKIISRYQKAIVNAGQIAQFVDRLYVYDNSIDNQEARILFRTTDGKLAKQYTDSIPGWAETIKNKLK